MQSCLAIGTREEGEGEVTITFAGASDDSLELPSLEVWDGTLELPSGEVIASTVLGDVVLTRQVSGSKTRTRVFVNHSTEPDLVVVMFEV